MAKGKYQRWLTDEGLLLLEGWARDGLTDEQIAKNIGIGVRTLYKWKDAYGQIGQALKKGKDVVDNQVENALLKRALGYRYVETRIESEGGGDDEEEKSILKTITTVKEVVPDTTAQIFWLKNRRPDKWRNNPPDVNDTKEQQARIDKLKAEVARMRGDDVELEDLSETDIEIYGKPKGKDSV